MARKNILNESPSYEQEQFKHAKEDHDSMYNLKLKVSGGKNSSQYFDIDKTQERKIYKILGKKKEWD
jgi:hypothetical protein